MRDNNYSVDRHPWTLGKPWQWPKSLWLDTATPAIQCDQLSGIIETETCVVGAGYTGLSTALHLTETGHEVCILEATSPGWGCSGRNGGQVNPAFRVLPSQCLKHFPQEGAEKLIHLASSTCDLIFDLIDRYSINCEAVRPGYVQGGVGHHGRGFIRRWVHEWQNRGVETYLLDAAEIADLIGTEFYDFGMYDARGGNLQPLSFLRGLHGAAVHNGAVIYADSPVIEVLRKNSEWRCISHGGEVRAKNLVWAGNGYLDSTFPKLRQTVVPVTSFIIASEPLPKQYLQHILPERHAVSETKRVQVYYKLDGTGRMIFGGRGNFWDTGLSGGTEHLKALAIRMFPDLASVRWTHSWGGHPAMTWDGLPKLFNIGEEAYAGHGYNGRGLAMSAMMGKQLANAVLNEPVDFPIQPLKPIAFHTARQIGISTHLIKGRLLDALRI